MKKLLRPLAHALYGICFFLMLLLPYNRYEGAGMESPLPEDTGECAFAIGLFWLICVLTQGVLALSAQNRQEEIVCVALLLLACILWGVKAYG
ncbi:MAG: hypothetical protein LBB76_07715 [Azoarcus sp.]|jgi:hypothetical protein|nr:hypothetical protein [Azoarcus sp.]